jgi:hypothetical protein
MLFNVRGQVELYYYEGCCSFESIFMKCNLTDPALQSPSKIVHMYGVTCNRNTVLEAAGLEAIMRSFGLFCANKDEILEKQFSVCNAL